MFKRLARRALAAAGGIFDGWGGGVSVTRNAPASEGVTTEWPLSDAPPDRRRDHERIIAARRAENLELTDGLSHGVIQGAKDSIVGDEYRLDAMPDAAMIYGGESDEAAEFGEMFAEAAQRRFNSYAESEECWFDARRLLPFTGLLRLQIGTFMMTGEVFEHVQFRRDPRRPFRTCFLPIAPRRICNPMGIMDSESMRQGIEIDRHGRPRAFHVRGSYRTDAGFHHGHRWTRVPARKSWGRREMIWIRDANLIDQTRGVSKMNAVAELLKTLNKFGDVRLKQAVLQTLYSFHIESQFPSEQIMESLGYQSDQVSVQGFFDAVTRYSERNDRIRLDDIQVPVLPPNTKLVLNAPQVAQSGAREFEEALHRRVAATLGVSYAEFSRDFSQGTYSSLRAEILTAHRNMTARKRQIADRLATMRYQAFIEEDFIAGNLPIPRGRNRTDIRRPGMLDAYTRCNWLGTKIPMIDALKETQAVVIALKAGLMTHKEASANRGQDWKTTFRQIAKEKEEAARLGIELDLDATRSGNNIQGDTMNSDEATDEPADGESGTGDGDDRRDD